MCEVFMTMWVVYDHPKDFPDCFVARKWSLLTDSTNRPENDVVTGTTLDEIRSHLPYGLVHLWRYENDDPTIVEVWV